MDLSISKLSKVTGAPSVCVLTEFRASSIRLRYLCQVRVMSEYTVLLLCSDVFACDTYMQPGKLASVGAHLPVSFPERETFYTL